MMKNARKLLLSTMLVVLTLFVFSACSKDDKASPEDENTEDTNENPDGNGNIGFGSAKATVTFLDTDEKVQFTGTGIGAMGTGSQDTVVLVFTGKEKPMVFWLMITPADEGKHTMGEGGFVCSGMFYPDSSEINVNKIYLVGADNIDDNDTEMDGKASFNISSQTTNKIKGTFELTMIQNSTVYQNGELQSGEIKKVKITNGTFNCPLYEASDFDDFD